MNGLGSYGEPIREKNLHRFDVAIEGARAVAREDASRGRDEGTCVLGAGVAVWALPSRARYPRRKVLIDAPFQGNVGSYHACQRALAVLQAAGLEGASWYDGVMD